MLWLAVTLQISLGAQAIHGKLGKWLLKWLRASVYINIIDKKLYPFYQELYKPTL